MWSNYLYHSSHYNLLSALKLIFQHENFYVNFYFAPQNINKFDFQNSKNVINTWTKPNVYTFSFVNVSVQFNSVAQFCLNLCDSMDCSTPGFPVHHQLSQLTQTHVHCFGDAIQPSHPLSSPSPPTFSLSHYQCLFQWVGSSHQEGKVLEFQHQSFQWIYRTDIL